MTAATNPLDGWGKAFLLIGVGSVLNALWMLIAPEGWYQDLPADVPDFGPFNVHFVRAAEVAEMADVDGRCGIGGKHGEQFAQRHVPERLPGLQDRQRAIEPLGVQYLVHIEVRNRR